MKLPEDFKIELGSGFSGKIALSGEPGMILDTKGGYRRVAADDPH